MDIRRSKFAETHRSVPPTAGCRLPSAYCYSLESACDGANLRSWHFVGRASCKSKCAKGMASEAALRERAKMPGRLGRLLHDDEHRLFACQVACHTH